MKTIDGSYGEGGGQVLRCAVALACLTGEPINITHIRGRRSNPGLQPQHLLSIQAAATLSGAKVEGAQAGSTEITFTPGPINGGKYGFDIGTAGSVTLVVQAILPLLVFAGSESEVRITGGTDVPWSPASDYLKQVVLPSLQSIGIEASMEVVRRGHYPRGGGEVLLRVAPANSLRALRLIERGRVESIRGVSHCSNLPPHVAQRQASSADRQLREKGYGNVRITTEVQQVPGGSPGSGIALWADSGGQIRIGADALGAREKRSEEVGAEAAQKLQRELQTIMAVDSHLADMLVPYLAVANGLSEVGMSALTLHSETMMWLTHELLGVEWQVKKTPLGAAVVRVNGVGLKNRLMANQ